MIRLAKVPLSTRILLTHKCNLSCDFCLNDASNTGDKRELQTEEWLEFFDRLKELLIFNIVLSGGEIFLRDDLFVLLKKLRENRVHRISLLTNGTLIKKEVAAQLNRLDIKNIAISIDGLEKTHEQIRGRGTFQKTIQGIRHLIDTGINPQVSFTPVRSNYKDLGPLIDLLLTLGVRVILVNTLTPEGRCLDIYKKITLEFPHQVKELLDVTEAKKRQYPEAKIECGLGFYYRLPQSYKYCLENPQHFEKKHLKDGCSAASTSCTVTSTGDVIPCEGFPTFVGGNIREQDLLDIWNNSGHFKTIRGLAKVSMDETPYCKKCKYRGLCDGGCRATAYAVHKDLLAPCVLCPYWEKNQVVKGSKRKSDARWNL
jgi:SynChlorMet cassette radical SAM/SPASM protein ScmE